MCVAYPGKVIAIDGDTATINYSGNTIKAKTGLVNTKVGDYALVHAGLVIQTLPEDEAEDMISLFQDLGEL